MATSGAHIHVVDGKQLAYPDGKCPFCNPEAVAPKGGEFVPKCYRKGDTIVVQASRGVMSTTTFWKKGNAIMHSVRKIQRGTDGKAVLGADKQPLWLQNSMRLSIAIAKEYFMELGKLLKEIETPASPSTTDVPQRG